MCVQDKHTNKSNTTLSFAQRLASGLDRRSRIAGSTLASTSSFGVTLTAFAYAIGPYYSFVSTV